MTPPEDILDEVDTYARIYGYDNYLVTIDLDDEIITEILIFDFSEERLVWINDWWEGQSRVNLLGFIPVSHIKIYANSVEIGRPVFGPDPVRVVAMTAFGKSRLEVIPGGKT